MKRGLLLVLFCLGTGLFYAQEVVEVQMPLITKRTATWCPNCGTYGWTMFNYLVEDNSEKAILVAAHYGGSDLQTNTSNAFATNMPGGGQPKFFVNNENQAVSSGNVDAARVDIQDQVNTLSQQAPLAAFGLDITLEGDEYTLNGLLRFMEELEGDFQLGVYQVEKIVIAPQSQQPNDAEHKQILTVPLTSETLADPLTSGVVSAGSEFDFSFTISNPADAENIEIVAILWDLDGGQYLYINGFKKDLTDLTPVSTGTVETDNDQVYGDVTYNDGIINLQNNNREFVNLDLIDIQGRVLHTFYQDELASGEFSFELPGHLSQQSGLFIIRAVWNQQVVKTQKIVRQ